MNFFNKFFVVAIAVGNVAALVPMRTSPKHVLRSRCSTAPQKSSVTMAAGPLSWCLAAPTMYALMSGNEYVTHRYYQHAEFNKDRVCQAIARVFFNRVSPLGRRVPRIKGGGHVEHHAETLDDMTLKTDERWMRSAAAISLNSDPFRGTAFTWAVSGMMLVQMLPSTIPVFAFLGFSLKTTFAILLPSMALHALVWNCLHPAMHGLPDIGIAKGMPARVMRSLRHSWYFNYLYQNHEGHHVLGGQKNFNVACPLFDHLCGTYVKEEKWRPMAKLPAEKRSDPFSLLDPEILAKFQTFRDVEESEATTLRPVTA